MASVVRYGVEGVLAIKVRDDEEFSVEGGM
jgi:hypothetical protein